MRLNALKTIGKSIDRLDKYLESAWAFLRDSLDYMSDSLHEKNIYKKRLAEAELKAKQARTIIESVIARQEETEKKDRERTDYLLMVVRTAQFQAEKIKAEEKSRAAEGKIGELEQELSASAHSLALSQGNVAYLTQVNSILRRNWRQVLYPILEREGVRFIELTFNKNIPEVTYKSPGTIAADINCVLYMRELPSPRFGNQKIYLAVLPEGRLARAVARAETGSQKAIEAVLTKIKGFNQLVDRTIGVADEYIEGELSKA